MADRKTPLYSTRERDRRWGLARKVMEEQNVDAMIIYGEHEDSGPAGYTWDTWFTNGRPGSTVVFPRSGIPIELVPYQLFLLDHSMAAIQDNPFWIPAKNLRMGRHSAVLIEVLKELNLEKATIGVVGLDPAPPWNNEGIIPYGLWKRILDAYPAATFTSISDAFVREAIVMSSEELAMVREAARIGEEMTKSMVNAAKIGNKETDVYAAASVVAHANGTVAPGMHLFAGEENAGSGPPQWTYRPHPPRTLENGTAIHSEVFSTFGQRHTQHQLSIAIGDVHPDIERAGEVARQCYEVGLNTIRPGITFGDVCKAMLIPTEEAGGWVRGPQIHSLNPLLAICGLSGELASRFNKIYTAEGYPEWQPMGNLLDDLVLKPGMAFAFEPSCGYGKHLVTVGGTVIVTEDGAEELNSLATRLRKVSGR